MQIFVVTPIIPLFNGHVNNKTAYEASEAELAIGLDTSACGVWAVEGDIWAVARRDWAVGGDI